MMYRYEASKPPTMAHAQQQMLTKLTKGMADKKGQGSKCFDPRHGIRATAAGKTVDLVICFECSWVYSYFGDEKGVQGVTTGTPQATFDKILKDAKVTLPKAK